MQSTRILLVDMPRMLREIVQTTLDAEQDMTVVGVTDRVADAPAGIDVVVVGTAAADLLDECRRLVTTSPALKVLAVSGDGREATFYELEPATHALGELSPVGIVDAIRAARERGLAWSTP